MAKEKTRPQRIGSILNDVLARMQLLKRIEELGAVEDWETIVGEQIARATAPRTVRNGKLIVEVRSSAWMSELVLMKNKILQRLNEGKKKGKITDIFFRLGEIETPDNRT